MILCVEDDKGIRDLIIYVLNSAGYETKGGNDGTELIEALKEIRSQLILLDIMLPDEDGITILKKLRANTATADIPVIMATAQRERSTTRWSVLIWARTTIWQNPSA